MKNIVQVIALEPKIVSLAIDFRMQMYDKIFKTKSLK